MAVHFDFVVEDAEAEVIIGLMRNQITRNHAQIMKAMIAEDHETKRFLERDTLFIEGLIAKMKNTRA